MHITIVIYTVQVFKLGGLGPAVDRRERQRHRAPTIQFNACMGSAVR
jgi:hypothetical protein